MESEGSFVLVSHDPDDASSVTEAEHGLLDHGHDTPDRGGRFPLMGDADMSGSSELVEPKSSKGDVKRLVACTVAGCKYSTKHKKDLVRHMRKHTGEKPYSCEVCCKEFSRRDKMQQHKRIHQGTRPFKCEVTSCHYACIDSSSLKKHVARVHSNNKPYKCQICSYSSKDSHQLNIHLRFHTGDSPYTCTFQGCRRAFKTTTDLQRHNRVHTKEKPYVCSYCDYATAVKYNLRVHLIRKHSLIENAGSQPMGIEDDRQDAESISPYKEVEVLPFCYTVKNLPFKLACRLCKYKGEGLRAFKLHMAKKHPQLNSEYILDDDVEVKEVLPKKSQFKYPIIRGKKFTKRYFCSDPLCKAGFVSEKSLRCHMKRHVTLHPPPAPTVEVVIPSSTGTEISIQDGSDEVLDFSTGPVSLRSKKFPTTKNSRYPSHVTLETIDGSQMEYLLVEPPALAISLIHTPNRILLQPLHDKKD